MAGIASTVIVEPRNLSVGERRRFAESLYQIHARVFDGVDAEEFSRYVVNSTAQSTRVLVFKNDRGEAVGYFAFHIIEKPLHGRMCAVVRAEAGMLRSYRGGSTTIGFALKEALKYKLRHPTRPAFYLGCLVHPSSYTLFARYAREIWPNLHKDTPRDVREFMDVLGDEFQLERVDGTNSLVRRVGWRTLETDVERNYWLSCEKPSAQFFMRTNAHYGEGNGLLTLIPLSAQNLAPALARFVHARQKPRIDAVRARVFGRFGRAFQRDAIMKVLHGAPLLRPLGDGDFENLARMAEVSRFHARQYVVRKGDRGDAMYIVVSGGAYVVVDREGEEHLLDELTAGEVFGEMALLTGEPRSASVRAASELTVLRLGREPIEKLLAARSGLRDAVWSAYLRRSLGSYLSTVPRFERLDRATQQRWIAFAQRVEVRSGGSVEIADACYIFVAAGAAELERGGEWFALKAPALLSVAGTVKVSSAEGAVLAKLSTEPDPEQSAAAG